MSRLPSYLRVRARWLAMAAALGLSWGALGAGPSSPDREGLIEFLGEQCSLQVDEILWEPPRGMLWDWWWGRPLLLTARPDGSSPSDPRDVFRTRVSLSPEGAALSVAACRNLSRTDSSDEHSLRGAPGVAVFASEGDATVPSLTFLRLEGDRTAPGVGWMGRAQLAMTRFFETGTWSGLGRTHVLASSPEDELSLSYEGGILNLGGVTSGRALDTKLSLRAPLEPQLTRSGEPSLTVHSVQQAPVAWLHFGANALRKIVGTETVARIEQLAFGLQDRAHRAWYGLTHPSAEPAPVPRAPTAVLPATAAPSPSTPAGTHWPPEDLPWASARHPRDGVWSAWQSPLLPKTAEPLFYRTVLHPDPVRPYAELHLVAADMRQLELGMRAGYEDPEPTSGPPGSGHLPHETAPRVVATFNGAFKTTHGGYGMKAEGRVLIPPQLGAATVGVTPSGAAGLGVWGPATEPEEFRAFRQNLDPLIRRGQVNPRGRTAWGEHVDATGVAIERSALCLHESGALVYAWATEATGPSLARGLEAAGCQEALHLDMNPGHCAFLVNRVQSVEPLRAQGEVLDARMKVNSTRYVRWSPKDFFYFALRMAPGGTPAEATSRGGPSWQVAPGGNPSPTQIPGSFVAESQWGPLTISWDLIAAHRVRLSVLPGSEDTPDGVSVPPPEASVLTAWGLGHQTHGVRPGLALGRRVLVPLDRRYATLVLAQTAEARLLPPGAGVTEADDRDLVQFPVLARDATLLEEAKELGGKRARGALCLREDGSLLVARMTHDSVAPLAQALVDQGCRLVVEMDRGSHSPPTVERATATSAPGFEPPRTQSRLLAIDRPMPHRTFAF